MLCRGIAFIGVKSNRFSGLLLLFLRNMVPSNFLPGVKPTGHRTVKVVVVVVVVVVGLL